MVVGSDLRPPWASGETYGDAAVDCIELCLLTVPLGGGLSNVLAYRHPNSQGAIPPL